MAHHEAIAGLQIFELLLPVSGHFAEHGSLSLIHIEMCIRDRRSAVNITHAAVHIPFHISDMRMGKDVRHSFKQIIPDIRYSMFPAMTLLLFSGPCQSAHRFYQRLSSGYWLPKRR